VQTMLTHLKID